MTLLAGLTTLLSRLSGQHDLAVGTQIAHRGAEELEKLIGFFVNTLVMRTDLSGDPSFRQLVERVRATALDAYAHQDLPFERLVEELEPDRDMSRNPLYQVSFGLQNAPEPELALADLELEPVAFGRHAARFDLELNLWLEPDGGLEGVWIFSTDLFDATTIARTSRQLCGLLTDAGRDGSQRLSRLRLLSAGERHQLLSEWGTASVERRAGRSLHALFQQQADRTPDAVAVCARPPALEGSLSYRELDQRAASLARRVRKTTPTDGDLLVGLCMERSLELMIGLLGILKAGGAYVPIDPAYPTSRQRLIVEDSGVALLLTQEPLRDRFDDLSVPVFCVDSPEIERSSQATTDLLATVSHEDAAAYVIYTSGSTGRPKGVVVRHGSVRRLLSATADWYRFGHDDVWTLFHSVSFDVSVWEIWGAWLYGGRVVIVPREVARSPEDFYDLVVHEGVTVLSQTPSAFRQLVAEDSRRASDPAAGQRTWATGTPTCGLRRRSPGAREPAAVDRAPRRRRTDRRRSTDQHVRHHRNHGAHHLPTGDPRRSGRSVVDGGRAQPDSAGRFPTSGSTCSTAACGR